MGREVIRGMDESFSQQVIIFPAFVVLRSKLFTLSLKQTVRVTNTLC